MAARYWVPASEELMAGDPQWPEGLRVVERGAMREPGVRWWLFEDDAADDDGNPPQGYELVFTRQPDGRLTWERSPLPSSLRAAPPRTGGTT